jgi:hypothetical protein
VINIKSHINYYKGLYSYLNQIGAELFQTGPQHISLHLKNIFEEGKSEEKDVPRAPVKTGKVSTMKESYGEGLASHSGPESISKRESNASRADAKEQLKALIHVPCRIHGI